MVSDIQIFGSFRGSLRAMRRPLGKTQNTNQAYSIHPRTDHDQLAPLGLEHYSATALYCTDTANGISWLFVLVPPRTGSVRGQLVDPPTHTSGGIQCHAHSTWQCRAVHHNLILWECHFFWSNFHHLVPTRYVNNTLRWYVKFQDHSRIII